uniref:Lipocalin n=1 Tax=Rhipicephalus zambeziensis TaxID=60191 RepID=A0A224YG88_9ACAR
MKGLFVVQFMLLHLLLDYSEGYTTGLERGNFSYCLKEVNGGENTEIKSSHAVDDNKEKTEKGPKEEKTVTGNQEGATEVKITQRDMPLLLTKEIEANWNTEKNKYRTINCTDKNDCPKNCTCFRHGMYTHYCAYVHPEEGEYDYAEYS